MAMTRTLSALILSVPVVLAPCLARAGNADPIVLVHGFLGWGPGELLGVPHWGGLHTDVAADLRTQGHEVAVGVVGPVSSNWDRAAELFAELTGTCTDYGAAHAAAHGHARFGRCPAAPLVANWGENRKIHLLAHSMGGTTATLLTHLLANGAPDEVAATGAATSPLFTGGKHWVRSITTLATPHNGTPFADNVDELLRFTRDAILGLITLVGAVDDNDIYDFKLDQWGLKRDQGESFQHYLGRVTASPVWKSRDLADVDLSTDGAAASNRRVQTMPDVTYFSFATDKTTPLPLTGHYVPRLGINPLLFPSAVAIGRYTRDEPGRPVITPDWWRNDGIVPTISAVAPTGHPMQAFDGTPRKGLWNYLGVKDNWDHLEIIGFGAASIRAFYRAHAALLAGLD
jgi:triacylglycerol lipase